MFYLSSEVKLSKSLILIIVSFVDLLVKPSLFARFHTNLQLFEMLTINIFHLLFRLTVSLMQSMETKSSQIVYII